MVAQLERMLIALACALLGMPGVAQATFPGKNGKIAFPGDGGIVTVNLDASDRATIGLSPYAQNRPAWSPDGRRLAFDRAQQADFSLPRDIIVVGADGAGETNLTNTDSTEADPAWSPDGEKLAFMGDLPSPTRASGLFVMNADGSARTVVSHDVAGPEWSPDGTRLAVGCGREQLCTIRPDGTGLTPLTTLDLEHPVSYRDPSWSPDGRMIAFVRREWPGGYLQADVWVMRADGTDKRQLTTSPVDDESPVWSPDGTKIAYVRDLRLRTVAPNGADDAPAPCCSSDFVKWFDWQPLPGPVRGDYRNAAQFCRAEREFLGEQEFSRRYGGEANAFGKCVSSS